MSVRAKPDARAGPLGGLVGWALVSGAFLGAALPGWPGALVWFAGLVGAVRTMQGPASRSAVGTAAVGGLAVGVSAYAVSLWWMVDVFRTFPGAAVWHWGVVVLMQAWPLALVWGAAAMGRRCLPLSARAGLMLGFGAWVVEFVQPLPGCWALGLDVPALWWPGALGGAPLFTGMSAWLAGLVWERPRRAVVGLTLWIGIGVGWQRPPGGGRVVRVGVVQPNTGAFEGRQASSAPELEARVLRLVRLVAQSEVVVTPEGAWPTDPGDSDGHRRSVFEEHLVGFPPLLMGATVGTPPSGNALVLVDHGRVVNRFEKTLLVPLAEQKVGGWGHDLYRPGTGARVLMVPPFRIGVLVCYEDLWGRAVARASVGADWLVAPTSDVWFGERGSRLHLNAARLAAVTSGRWVVRPALSGPSAVIDAHGRLRWQTSWVDGDRDQGEGLAQQVAVQVTRPTINGALVGMVLGPLCLIGYLSALMWQRNRS